MKTAHSQRRRIVAATLAGLLALAACGSDDSSSGETSATGGSAAPSTEEVTLSLLIDEGETSTARWGALTKAYTAEHPNVTFSIETRPGGGDGDNIVKTRLATGEMADLFHYNSGALLDPLNPAESLVDLAGSPFLENVAEGFLPTVTRDGKVFGVPMETGMGGGILYNKKVFEANGLEVPKTWDELVANNDKLLAAGVTPMAASFADTWTSQLLVLSDYFNIQAEVPTFAADFDANKIKYADNAAALRGFEHVQQGFEQGWWNSDFGSTTMDQALEMLATGKVAQYPMLTFALGSIAGSFPDAVSDIGFFATPGDSADANGLTLWMPQALYIASTSKHADVAKDFLAFVASVPGTETITSAVPPSGPYLIKGAELPDDVLPGVKDLQAYIDSEKFAPALEFVTALKGPALEQLLVAVGSGLQDAKSAAADYDKDIVKQAQQLGLAGW